MSIQPYQLEPEYSSSEQGEEEQIDSGEEEVSSLDSLRLESRRTDLSWGECRRCWTRSEGHHGEKIKNGSFASDLRFVHISRYAIKIPGEIV